MNIARLDMLTHTCGPTIEYNSIADLIYQKLKTARLARGFDVSCPGNRGAGELLLKLANSTRLLQTKHVDPITRVLKVKSRVVTSNR
jgi:hypothetical protein